MFEKIGNFFNKLTKPEVKELTSKDAAKERLHLVLMQDRANVSVDFLELMKQEIIDVIKKYIVVDESSIDVRLTNQENEDGTNGAPSLYANIPIINIKNEIKAEKIKDGTLMYENGELEKAPVQENIEKLEDEVSTEQKIILEPTNSIENFEKAEEVTEPYKYNEDIKDESPATEEDEPIIEETNIEEVKDKSNVIELGAPIEEVNVEQEQTIVEIEDDEKVEANEDLVVESEDEEIADKEIIDLPEDEEIDDEDGEDVTFDDLLKKAEAEEAEIQEDIDKSDEEDSNVEDSIKTEEVVEELETVEATEEKVEEETEINQRTSKKTPKKKKSTGKRKKR